jgi:hypothetical protein
MRAVRSATLAACALLCGGAASADITRLPPDVATAIASTGPNLTRDVGVKTNALMGPLAPDAYDMAARTCVRDGKCPAFLYLKGHNHISEIGSVGSKDDELGSRILDFVRTTKLTERMP